MVNIALIIMVMTGLTGGWFIIIMGVYALFGGTIFSDKPREFYTLHGFTCFFPEVSTLYPAKPLPIMG